MKQFTIKKSSKIRQLIITSSYCIPLSYTTPLSLSRQIKNPYKVSNYQPPQIRENGKLAEWGVACILEYTHLLFFNTFLYLLVPAPFKKRSYKGNWFLLKNRSCATQIPIPRRLFYFSKETSFFIIFFS